LRNDMSSHPRVLSRCADRSDTSLCRTFCIFSSWKWHKMPSSTTAADPVCETRCSRGLDELLKILLSGAASPRAPSSLLSSDGRADSLWVRPVLVVPKKGKHEEFLGPSAEQRFCCPFLQTLRLLLLGTVCRRCQAVQKLPASGKCPLPKS